MKIYDRRLFAIQVKKKNKKKQSALGEASNGEFRGEVEGKICVRETDREYRDGPTRRGLVSGRSRGLKFDSHVRREIRSSAGGQVAMATDRENRVAGADQYERGSSVPVPLARPPGGLRESPLPCRRIAAPARCFRGRPLPRAYASLRARKSVRKYVRAYTRRRGSGGSARETARGPRRARTRGFRRREDKRETRDAARHVLPRRVGAARRRLISFRPDRRVDGPLSPVSRSIHSPGSPSGALSPRSSPHPPPSRAAGLLEQSLRTYLFSGTCYFPLSLFSLLCSPSPGVPVTSFLSVARETEHRAGRSALRRHPSFHPAVTSADVHCYHATALAPPPGTEGEINESKVRHERS